VAGRPVEFRFYGELNDFLPAARRNTQFDVSPGPTDTNKHVIESLGVPHTEVGRVIVDGRQVELSAQIEPGSRIDVFPYTQPVLLEDPRFVVDGHLGRLAAYLRMLGLDTWYGRTADDVLLAGVANREARVLLTRDVGLLKRREVERGYCVRSDKPHQQLHEVSQRFALPPHFSPFRRCMECNADLRAVSKDEVAELLPPHTRATKNDFSRCTGCGKVFWRGSHHARMLTWIEELTTDECGGTRLRSDGT
jgi:uncharacterized protein with PIN domain